MSDERPIRAHVDDDPRTGLSVEALKRGILDNLFDELARFPAAATLNDKYLAVAYTVRDRLLRRWVATSEAYLKRPSRGVCYLSAEFLLGPHLGANLVNLGVYDEVRQAVRELGWDFEAILEQEEEPGLGNGGLGRLAACFMESLATLQLRAIGYGIRYEFGIFDQVIRDGWQVEITDKWLRFGNPWEVERPEISAEVKFGGRTETFVDEAGRRRVRWIPGHVVRAEAYDTPILGHQVNTTNMLRLWKAEACESFDFQAFNVGDYYGAVHEKMASENITKVLYPNDEPMQGKQLRLEQQHFLVSASLQDMLRIFKLCGGDVSRYHEHTAIQLNDTHPALAVPELMRLLMDDNGLEWAPAWEITRSVFGYTNHTLLPEALEKWPLPLFGALLPRHLEIIFEINRHFLDEVRARFPGDEGRLARMSLIDETPPRYVRMAHVAAVGSHKINGVAELHSALLRGVVLRDFAELWPERFTNVTNGVTPRRFLALINPGLSRLIDRAVGPGWRKDLMQLRGLVPLAEDAGFRAEWRAVKRANKEALADEIARRAGVGVDPESLFDVQVKRIHEYKRQHLNVLHVIALYNRLRRDPGLATPPRTVIFGGKAAPGYHAAKLIIKLIHSVGEVVNSDPAVAGRLRVVFIPDYNVKNCQRIFPAAELSEQISTAGKEASGTGNMKFTMNGALTIGTLDGANVEIREEVGAENFFLFGLTVEQVDQLRSRGYRPRDYYARDPELREALDQLSSGYFSRGDAVLFRSLVDGLLNEDPYLLLADFRSYVNAQKEVGGVYLRPEDWTRMSILNTARVGKFSSDRAIADYCREIWRAAPAPVTLGESF